MSTIQRSYIYTAAYVSLMAVSWAVIALGRNVIGGINRSNLAWQLAIVVIGLPIFLAHWRWAGRLTQNETPEEESTGFIRYLYLYLVMAAFLGPWLYQAFRLLNILFDLFSGAQPTPSNSGSNAAVALVVLGVLWGYHKWMLAQEEAAEPDTDGKRIVRELYFWGFALAGLIMASVGIVSLLSWLLDFIGGQPDSNRTVFRNLPRLIIGVPLWMICWLQIQNYFEEGHQQPYGFIIRKLFLYILLFVGLLTAVLNIVLLVDGILLWMFDRPVPGDWRDVVPLIFVSAVIWTYHYYVLGEDARMAPFRPAELIIQHSYQYLTAAVGLAATLVGVAGVLSLLILTAFGDPFEVVGFAGFLSVLIAGLPLWLWSWGLIQRRYHQDAESATKGSGSLVRRLYLYFFLLVSTLTVLGSGIFVVYTLFLLLFDRSADIEPSQLALGAAYLLLGAGIWIYHWRLIQTDSARLSAMREEEMAEVMVALLSTDSENDEMRVNRLRTLIERRLPQVTLDVYEHDTAAAGIKADIVVADWQHMFQSEASETAAAWKDHEARKIIIPSNQDDWNWVGVESGSEAKIARETVDLIEQVILGQEGGRKRSIGMIVVWVVVGFFVLTFILPTILSIIFSGF